MSLFVFNSKEEGINALTNYFKKFNSNKLKYYLENTENLYVDDFFELNVYDYDNVELKRLFLSHLLIVFKKIFNINNYLNYVKGPYHLFQTQYIGIIYL